MVLLGTLLLVFSSASVGAHDLNNEALIDHRDIGAPRSLLAVKKLAVKKSLAKIPEVEEVEEDEEDEELEDEDEDGELAGEVEGFKSSISLEEDGEEVSTLQTNGDDVQVFHTGLPDDFVNVTNGTFNINGLPVRPLAKHTASKSNFTKVYQNVLRSWRSHIHLQIYRCTD